MASGAFSKEEIEILKQNEYVSAVNDTQIIYSNDFKFYFMQKYSEGQKPTQIFRDAGFDPKILGSKRIERAAYRWKKCHASGSLGSGTGGISANRYKKLSEMQKEIDSLKAENERLKEMLKNIKVTQGADDE